MTKEKFNDCLSAIRDGHKGAAEAIYSEYYEKFKYTALSILRDPFKAEDAASNAILQIFDGALKGRITYVEYPNTYMYKTIRNEALDILDSDAKTVPLDSISEIAFCTEDKFVNKMIVRDAISKLPPDYFKIAEMFYLYRIKIKQIAAETDTPEGTVKWKLSEIRKALHKKLREK